MSDNAHDLEFTVLLPSAMDAQAQRRHTDLETLVLENPLDGRILTTGRQLRLEDYAKGAITDDFALRVGEVLVVAGQAVLDLFADNFCMGVSMLGRQGDPIGLRGGVGKTYHPFLVRKRPMAGSGSLFGVMRRGGGSASAARIAIGSGAGCS